MQQFAQIPPVISFRPTNWTPGFPIFIMSYAQQCIVLYEIKQLRLILKAKSVKKGK